MSLSKFEDFEIGDKVKVDSKPPKAYSNIGYVVGKNKIKKIIIVKIGKLEFILFPMSLTKINNHTLRPTDIDSKQEKMPFAKYKDFDNCVSKNKDKGNPQAYCGSIKAKTEKMKLNKKLRKSYFERLNNLQKRLNKESLRAGKEVKCSKCGTSLDIDNLKGGACPNCGTKPSSTQMEGFSKGDIVHTPGGTAKVINSDGTKVNVRIVDGGVDQQYEISKVQAESFKEAYSFDKEFNNLSRDRIAFRQALQKEYPEKSSEISKKFAQLRKFEDELEGFVDELLKLKK